MKWETAIHILEWLINRSSAEWTVLHSLQAAFHLFKSLALEHPSNPQYAGMAGFCWQQEAVTLSQIQGVCWHVSLLKYFCYYHAETFLNSSSSFGSVNSHNLKSVGLLVIMYILGKYLCILWVMIVFDMRHYLVFETEAM